VSGEAGGSGREGLDVTVALAASSVFGLLSVLVHWHRTRAVDRRSWRKRWFGRTSRRSRRRVERVSRVLSPLAFGAAGGAAAALLYEDGRHEAAEAMLATAALGALGDHVLKAPFRRRRPPESWFGNGWDSSFPSGHSMAACAVPAVLGYTLFRERMVPPAGGVAMAVIPPVIVGGARLFVRKHWATDVVAGWAAGLAAAGVAAAWYEVRRGA
jgi:membrane-associated phospholipid phosphatase